MPRPSSTNPSLLPVYMPMCNMYLKDGAYAFLGSSTIAYGPAIGNGQADLICQYFLQHILQGASVGRATLEARLQFMRTTGQLSPADLKTLAQFNPLGDPSIHAVCASEEIAHAVSTASTAKSVKGMRSSGGRLARRKVLAAIGELLGKTTSFALWDETLRRKPTFERKLLRVVRDLSMKDVAFYSYRVHGELQTAHVGTVAKELGASVISKAAALARANYHVVLTPPAAGQLGGPVTAAVVVAREAEDELLDYVVLLRR